MSADEGYSDHPERGKSDEFFSQEEQGHVTHDMKSPFNGIVGLTEAMKMMVKDEVKKKRLTLINRAGARFCGMVEENVVSDKLARGWMKVTKEDVSLGAIVEEVVELMKFGLDGQNMPTKSDEVALENQTGWGEEGPMVKASERHVAKAVYAVVHNALKFTEKGHVICTSREEPEHVVLSVHDSGVGIPEVEWARIFEPWVRLKPGYHNKFTCNNDGESWGLGLSSAKESIEKICGGKIFVRSSEVGRGSVFEIWFPKEDNCIEGEFEKGVEGFGYWAGLSDPGDRWLVQKRGLGQLAHMLVIPHLGITGLADVLIKTEVKKPMQKQLGMIYRCGLRVVEVMSLIRDGCMAAEPLLAYHAPSGGVDLGPIVQSCHEELLRANDKRGQPMKKDTVEFINKVPKEGGLPLVKQDPHRLRRIVHQLADNALKFTAKGSVTLSAEAEGDGGVRFIVVDTGCGFTSDEKEKLNHPFYRAQPETYYGIGLGLNMVQNMCDKMGLTLAWHGKKDTGATFEVVIPAEMKQQNLSVMGEGGASVGLPSSFVVNATPLCPTPTAGPPPEKRPDKPAEGEAKAKAVVVVEEEKGEGPKENAADAPPREGDGVTPSDAKSAMSALEAKKREYEAKLMAKGGESRRMTTPIKPVASDGGEVEKLKAELAEEQRKVAEAVEAAQAAEKKAAQAAREADKAREEKVVFQKKANELDDRVRQLEREVKRKKDTSPSESPAKGVVKEDSSNADKTKIEELKQDIILLQETARCDREAATREVERLKREKEDIRRTLEELEVTSLANHIERLKSDIVGLQHELAKARNENVALHLKYSKLQSTDSRGEIARLQDEVEKLTGDLRAVREASLAGFTMGRRPQEKFGGNGSVEYFADPSKSLLAVNSTAVAGATSADPTLAHLQTATTLLQAQVSEAYRVSSELRGFSGISENFYRPTVTMEDGVEGGTLNSVHGERWGVDKHLMATDIYSGVFPADAYRYNYNYFPSPEAPKEAADGGGKGLNVMFAGGKERRASNFKSGGELMSNRGHRQAIFASSGSAAGRFNSTKTGSRKGSRQGSVVGGDGRKQSLASKYLSERKSYVSSRGRSIFLQEKICLNLMLASAEEVDLSESVCEKICFELAGLDWEEIGSKVRLAMGGENDHVIDFKVETQRKGKRFSSVSSFDITRAVAEKVSFISGGRWRGRVNPKPAVVIRIFINDDWVIVDIPVMERIDRSGGRKCVGLASPVAWAMNKQARSTMDFIGLKDTRDLIILDPFCGTGATIFERSEAKRWGIGIDAEKFQIEKLKSNSEYLSEVDVDGILGDGRRLCMRKDTVDVIISDLPFGVQWCSEDTQKLEDLYRLALPEFGRLCRDSGVMVLLTKESLVDLVMESLSSSWAVVHIRKVKLGEMPSAIVTIVSRKNAEKFSKFSGPKQRFDWESIQGRSEWAALKCNLRPPLKPIGYL
ncbi:hypothetical protein FOZ61_002460 [Perkinsus olseni]|uniref:histidine kinase n=1 Tax=Perkinsus olseni TaxID=32597 RepID=A0A7J6LTA9_PEROL|nr:hypothetical protein FOZ61_002460 [Perkinsus olseni]